MTPADDRKDEFPVRENVLSICTGMGLLDRAFMDQGSNVIPGCEIDPRMRAMHAKVCGGEYLHHDLADLVAYWEDDPDVAVYDGIIGGPPCQSHTKLRAIRDPKYPDLTPLVNRLLDALQPEWYLFENVAPLDIPGAQTVMLDAMHFAKPHQSRARWFTYSPNLTPPSPAYTGTVDELMAYSIVAGRIYGAKRAAVLQGYPKCLDLGIPAGELVLGLANAVHYEVAFAWADAIDQRRRLAA